MLAIGPDARREGLPRLVKALDLELWGEEQDDELARVLGACEGLEELVVTYIERAHLEDFAAGPTEAGADAHALVFPQLRTLGLYWDAAYSRLAGASLLLPPSAASPSTPPPAYVHLALYPAALPALRAALLALLEGAGTRWRGVEHFRLEGTVRDLDRVEERRSDNDDDEEEDTETVRENPTSAILRAARKAGVDLLIEEAPTDDAEGIDGPQRATFTRGFGTSWWRFVREVEQERVQLART
ncbi:hypothetical protein JCM10450v2_007867 [Rhodotorula kratochvilovae]